MSAEDPSATPNPVASIVEDAVLGCVQPMSCLWTAQWIRRWLEYSEAGWVDEARRSGHTWEEIGEALGTSRQAAWDRFSKSPGTVTSRPRGRMGRRRGNDPAQVGPE